MLNIDKEVAEMNRMTVNQLREKFAEVFGEVTNGRNKVWLIKRIAWRMQANEEGGLSERALKRAMELANDADLRVTAPRQRKLSEGAAERTTTITAVIEQTGELMPGVKLQRNYKGRLISVTVLDSGFEFEGERYKSLTAISKAVTGKHWNGFHFFGLRGNGAKA